MGHRFKQFFLQKKVLDINTEFQVVWNDNSLYCYTLNNVNMGKNKSNSKGPVKVRKVNDN